MLDFGHAQRETERSESRGEANTNSDEELIDDTVVLSSSCSEDDDDDVGPHAHGGRPLAYSRSAIDSSSRMPAGRPSASPMTGVQGMSASFAPGAMNDVNNNSRMGSRFGSNSRMGSKKFVSNVDNLLVKRKRCPVDVKQEMPSIKNSILYDYGSVVEETGSVLA